MASHPPITDIRGLLTFRLAMLVAANDRVGQSWLLSRYGLRIQEWRTLGLVAASEPVRFKDVARALLLDKGQLSRLVKALTGRGLLEGRADEADQRTLLLTVTAEGRRLHDQALAEALRRNNLIAGALTAEEAATLFRLLDKLQPFMDHRVEEAERERAGPD